jgi:rhodanese-related sulfurtransferase
MQANHHSRILAAAVALTLAPHAGAQITAAQLREKLAGQPPPMLVDVRPLAAFQTATIPGAINIPARVLLDKKLALGGECILFSDGLHEATPARLVEDLRKAGVTGADYLEGGFAAWMEMREAPSTGRTGAVNFVGEAITYEDLLKTDEKVSIIDLRPAAARTPAVGRPCPVAKICAERRFGYRGSLPDFHANEKRRREASNPGTGDLVVLVDDGTGISADVQKELLAEGYRRVVVLLGGAETIALEGRRGRSRVGGVIGEADASDLERATNPENEPTRQQPRPVERPAAGERPGIRVEDPSR